MIADSMERIGLYEGIIPYAKELEAEYDEVLCYGIAFFKKRCLVKRQCKEKNKSMEK